MRGFFQVRSVAEFLELLGGMPVLGREAVALDRADGRVLAREVAAREDIPQTDRAVMDGYALRAADTFGAGEANPAYLTRVAELEITASPDSDGLEVGPGQCAAIVTGGCLPQGADAVVMVEHTRDMGHGTIEVRASVAPGEHLMERGEDARAGETALAAGRVLRPQEIGFLAALGQAEVEVAVRPRVGILSTGDELVDVGAEVRPGLVRDVNSYTLECLVRRAGALPARLGIVRDREPELRAALTAALAEHDVVLLSGGSSVGVRDLTLEVVGSLPKAEILAHGVAVSPGKPLILARVGGKTVWGLPGQVASAQVVMAVFVRPFLRLLMGDARALDRGQRVTTRARLSRNLASKAGREDYVRARLVPDPAEPDGLPLALPVPGKSGLLRTMLDADGLLCIPADKGGLFQGDEVDLWLFSP